MGKTALKWLLLITSLLKINQVNTDWCSSKAQSSKDPGQNSSEPRINPAPSNPLAGTELQFDMFLFSATWAVF